MSDQPALFHDDGAPESELRCLNRDGLVARVLGLREDLVSLVHERDQAIELAEQRKTERDVAKAELAEAFRGPNDSVMHATCVEQYMRAQKELNPLRARVAELERERSERAGDLELVEHADQLARMFETLRDLVRCGAIESAAAFVREIDNGAIETGVQAVTDGDRVKLTGWAVRDMAAALAEHLDKIRAPNHCAWTLSFPDGRKLNLTAQWVGGVTVAERIAKAERERDAVLGSAREYLEAIDEVKHGGDPLDRVVTAEAALWSLVFAAIAALVFYAYAGGAR